MTETDLEGLAGRAWDPLSVVVLLTDRSPSDRPSLEWGLSSDRTSLEWGLSEARFDHRNGMVTKAEVRAIALGKLGLVDGAVFWDVGAGSGSVAIEVARLVRGASVFAIERDPGDAARIATNADEHGVALTVVAEVAPGAFEGLPDPDRVFVGGGGPEVLDAVLKRLRPGGQVVANFASLDRAQHAYDRLGHLVQVSLSRGERLPDGALRLGAQNPVFVAWGPNP